MGMRSFYSFFKFRA